MSLGFNLAQIFTDNMVLQKDVKVPIWGEAPSDSNIVVEIHGQVKETLAVNGKWFVLLSPLKSGGPYELNVTCDNSSIIIRNILVGEVWVAGGQSNMEFNLQKSLKGREYISGANYPNIRYYDVPKIEYEDGLHSEDSATQNSWLICTPENAGKFSAVAYHFAVDLYENLDVPIGIIGCNWGGTSASCWMSTECLAEHEDLKAYLDEYNEQISTLSNEVYEKQRITNNLEIEEYNAKCDKFRLENPGIEEDVVASSVEGYPWPPPMGPKCFLRPSGLYNTMLKKIIPYEVKGVLWYQGETDAEKPTLYRKLFSTMIGNWRNDWKNPELPFLFVQLPAYAAENPLGDDWALLRESQLHVMKNLNKTFMVVSIDCGEKDNIHPVNKKPIGERLAILALSEIYRQKSESTGPIYNRMDIDGNKIILYFNHMGRGLSVKGVSLRGFEICGSNKRFVPAKAEIINNTVVVYSDEINCPYVVRYGWSNYPDINLYNIEGLPASPFRTDSL